MKHLNFRWQFDKFHHFRPHRHYKQRSDRANKKPVDSRNPFREHYGIQSSRSQSTWISKTHFTKFPNLCASSLQHRSVKTIQKTVDSPDQVREHYITQVSDHKPREFLETIWKKKNHQSHHIITAIVLVTKLWQKPEYSSNPIGEHHKFSSFRS